MHARFIREALDGVCHVFGTDFEAIKWVDVDHLSDDQRAALITNPTFETKAHDKDADSLVQAAAEATPAPTGRKPEPPL